ncbi:MULTISPECIES: heavy-metal-associated domain-containing protein [unclassified Acinetobacter]|uniref:heavy-metal-associated domain-containing protein n=1 Tax=unclassified Acinetobacter TaxID=196816 RepID=UPI000449B873|nr:MULTISPECIES: heavy-metal-associated domain-containing protein [unclassified Acinetobacter]EZQ02141.1 heavy metal transporter [Acinetobacter sp. Ver3]SEL39766.1 copper chaperone [Acinetobacter sp. DSM 11652]
MKLFIENISCSGCAKGVTASVLSLDPNASVNVDVANKIADIRTTYSFEKIAEVLTEDGFPPELKD